MKYDYIVVGGGPTGLLTAYLLAKDGYRVCIVEREKTLGGCHRVRRFGGKAWFTEHGPRVYLNNYVTFIAWLEDMGLQFDDYFTDYKFTMTPGEMPKMPVKDWFYLAWHHFVFTLSPGRYKSLSMNDVFKEKLNDSTMDYLDRICRLTDGAGSDTYTAFEFFQLSNQNILYKIKQPRVANDQPGGWVHAVEDKLHRMGVRFVLNAEVSTVDEKHQCVWIAENNLKLEYSKQVLLCVPPQPLKALWSKVDVSQIKNYETYIPITFHWNRTDLTVPRIWGQGHGDWNIAYIVLSDYIKNEGTVISTCISRLNTPGSTGKTANQTLSKAELIQETRAQLAFLLDSLPEPDKVIVSEGVYYANGQWLTRDTAFMASKTQATIPQNLGKTIVSLGTHNGKNSYSFTSLEAALENVLHWKTDHGLRVRRRWTIRKVLVRLLLVLIVVYIALRLR